MEGQAAQLADVDRSSHHREGSHRHSRRKAKKILQRIGILAFLLLVMLVFLYVWFSSGSAESTGFLLRPAHRGLNSKSIAAKSS